MISLIIQRKEVAMVVIFDDNDAYEISLVQHTDCGDVDVTGDFLEDVDWYPSYEMRCVDSCVHMLAMMEEFERSYNNIDSFAYHIKPNGGKLCR